MAEDLSQEESEPVVDGTKEPAPQGKTSQIKEALLAGESEASLKTRFNETTVRMAAFDLEKLGLRQRDAKPPPGGKQDGNQGAGGGQAVAFSGDGKIVTSAKGSPPEALINAVSVPTGDRVTFESGMKFGMSLVVLGVRVAQELSSIGVQQATPLIALAKDMRSGEAAAAKAAAVDAAQMAAGEVQSNIAPLLAHLANTADKPAASGNPMADMMTRLMEPVMKNAFGKIVPGMQQDPEPTGWARRRE